MKRNQTMMQFFEWFVEPDGEHWNRLKERAAELSERGITAVWIPPVTKGQSDQDTGYGIYDAYDLGEFDQKGTVRTKYGTKDEYLEAVNAVKGAGMNAYADVVPKHRLGAEETEEVEVEEICCDNRNAVQSGKYKIRAWSHFKFP